MAAALFGEPLAQGFQKLVEAAQRLDLLFLFFSEVFFGELSQPLGRYFGVQRLFDEIEALKDVAEHAIELVEVALVLHQRGTRQIVEIFDPTPGQIPLHGLHQRQILTERHRQAGLLQLVEEGRKHRCILGAKLIICAAGQGY